MRWVWNYWNLRQTIWCNPRIKIHFFISQIVISNVLCGTERIYIYIYTYKLLRSSIVELRRVMVAKSLMFFNCIVVVSLLADMLLFSVPKVEEAYSYLSSTKLTKYMILFSVNKFIKQHTQHFTQLKLQETHTRISIARIVMSSMKHGQLNMNFDQIFLPLSA